MRIILGSLFRTMSSQAYPEHSKSRSVLTSITQPCGGQRRITFAQIIFIFVEKNAVLKKFGEYLFVSSVLFRQLPLQLASS